jgi:hypothetical protein
MSISQIARTISASPTLTLNEKAAILREKGEPITHPHAKRKSGYPS